MIRIERGREVGPDIFEYAIPSLQICGRSRQPLLDSCRSIKRAGDPTELAEERAGVFRDGKAEPDISCLVLLGAELTVAEPNHGKIHFTKFREFDSSAFLRPSPEQQPKKPAETELGAAGAAKLNGFQT